MKKGTEYTVDEGVKATGLLANHDQNVFPQHILFEIDGKKILYACDGAWFLHETYYALKNTNLDFLVLDCTCGDYDGGKKGRSHRPILR